MGRPDKERVGAERLKSPEGFVRNLLAGISGKRRAGDPDKVGAARSLAKKKGPALRGAGPVVGRTTAET